MNKKILRNEVTKNGTRTKENERILKARTCSWESSHSTLDTLGFIFFLVFLSSKCPGLFCIGIVLSFLRARKTRLSNLLLLQNLHNWHRKTARALLCKRRNCKRQQKSHEPIPVRLPSVRFVANCSIHCLYHTRSDSAKDHRASTATNNLTLLRSCERRPNKAKRTRLTYHGKRMMNLVPLPFWLSRVIASVIRWATAKPKHQSQKEC